MATPYEIVNSKTGYRFGRKFDTKSEANAFIKQLQSNTNLKLHWVAKPWPYTGGRKAGVTHFNPANPSDSALAGARILGVTRNRAGKVTALKLQLRAGAGGGGGARSNPVKVYRTLSAAQKAHDKLLAQGHYDAGVVYDAATRTYKVMWKGAGGGGARSNPTITFGKLPIGATFDFVAGPWGRSYYGGPYIKISSRKYQETGSGRVHTIGSISAKVEHA